MKIRQLISFAAWGALVLFMLPAMASTQSTEATDNAATADQATPLDGNHCWARCSTCTTRCAAVHGSDRERCERLCQAGNDNCCEATGRHGSPRTCGCY
ncbi:MAG: hypothetical protein JWP87_3931 [Labilithrix sp.]|nr:hypothetical protein [Labilithrix sp.]